MCESTKEKTRTSKAASREEAEQGHQMATWLGALLVIMRKANGALGKNQKGLMTNWIWGVKPAALKPDIKGSWGAPAGNETEGHTNMGMSNNKQEDISYAMP